MNRQEIIRVLKSMNVQSQRNEGANVLYQGNLQDNPDTYYRPNHLYSQDSVPPPPPAIYREIGATTEVDKRMFFIPQPMVPTSAAQEALNQYFANRRVEEFARGQQRLAVGDILSKQAEQNAERLIKDELDRRVNIRTAVLNATGMTPAQIQEELVREGLSGAMSSQTVFDARDQQVQNAVGQYYNRMGGEVMPATLPSTNPIASTVPSIIAPAGTTTVPAPAAPAPKPSTSDADFGAGTGAVPEAEELEEANSDEPPELEYVGFDEFPEDVMPVDTTLSNRDLAQMIIDRQIKGRAIAASGIEQKTYNKNGNIKQASTLITYGKGFLIAILTQAQKPAQRPSDSTVGSGK